GLKLAAILLAYYKVVVAMSGRCVNQARAGLASAFPLLVAHVELCFGIGFAAQRHKRPGHQQRWSIEPGMPGAQALEQFPWKLSQSPWSSQTAVLDYGVDQVARDNVDLAAEIECRVGEIRMHRYSDVGRQRPRSGGPNENVHRFGIHQ